MSNRTERHDKIQQIAAKIIDLNTMFALREGLKKIDTDLLRKYTQDLYDEVLQLETELGSTKPVVSVAPPPRTHFTPEFPATPITPVVEAEKEQPIEIPKVEEATPVPVPPVAPVVPPVPPPVVEQVEIPKVEAPIAPPAPQPVVTPPVQEIKPVVVEKPVELPKPEPIRNEPAPQPEQHDLASKLQHTPIHDLKKAISINKKFEFINQLFKGDHEAYAKSVHYINGLTNGNEAQVFFNNLKKQFAWDEDNKLFIELADLVKRRFVK